MRKTIGKASDFYHVRLITLKENSLPEVEWREDILYRTSEASQEKVVISYNLEVVNIDSRKTYLIKNYPNKAVAAEKLKEMQDDLEILNKRGFEDKYNFFELGDF